MSVCMRKWQTKTTPWLRKFSRIQQQISMMGLGTLQISLNCAHLSSPHFSITLSLPSNNGACTLMTFSGTWPVLTTAWGVFLGMNTTSPLFTVKVVSPRRMVPSPSRMVTCSLCVRWRWALTCVLMTMQKELERLSPPILRTYTSADERVPIVSVENACALSPL